MKFKLVVGTLFAVACVCAGWLVGQFRSGHTASEYRPGFGRTSPVRVARKVEDGNLERSVTTRLLTELRALPGLTLSDVLHLIKLKHYLKFPIDEELKVVLDGDLNARYFGDSSFYATREGIRCRTMYERDSPDPRATQSHRGLLLASLGEIGVSLSEPLTVSGDRYSVRSILEDTVLNFDISEREIEWDAVALALYLPPQRTWRDKYGRTYSFDDVAVEILRRIENPRVHSCGGTHLLYCLSLLSKVNGSYDILSPGTVTRIRGKLSEVIEELASSDNCTDAPNQPKRQTFSFYPAGASDQQRIMISGHHLEWLSLLPDSHSGQHLDLTHVRAYLARSLSALSHLDRSDICPVTHAIMNQ